MGECGIRLFIASFQIYNVKSRRRFRTFSVKKKQAISNTDLYRCYNTVIHFSLVNYLFQLSLMEILVYKNVCCHFGYSDIPDACGYTQNFTKMNLILTQYLCGLVYSELFMEIMMSANIYKMYMVTRAQIIGIPVFLISEDKESLRLASISPFIMLHIAVKSDFSETRDINMLWFATMHEYISIKLS